MKITNKLNLPQPLVSFVDKEYQYKPKRYSVTTILRGAKETLLERRHADEIEMDVSENIFALFGTAIHKVLEESQEAMDELKEAKIEVEMPNGYTLSGQADLYSESLKRVTDYKSGTVWKVIYGDWEDYRLQILAYAWMLRKLGFPVDNGENVMVLKDWSKTKAKLDITYPQHQVYVRHYDFTEDDFAYIEELLTKRFENIEKYEKLEDDEIPICSSIERWATPTTHAVMKKGRKSAVRVFNTMVEAMDFVEKSDEKLTIEDRLGTDKKCCDYCRVNKFCNYYKSKYER